MVSVFDLDDLCDEWNPYDALMDLKEKHPDLRVTLFAIPYRCSDGLLARYRALDWVELGVHGYHHSTMECAAWGYEEAKAKLEEIEQWWPGAKVFKAPGWVANPEVYRALKDGGWKVADNALQSANWCESPMERYVYNLPGEYTALHGHTWETCDNGPSKWSSMINGSRNYRFVSEVARPFEAYDSIQETRNSWSHNSSFGQRAVQRMLDFVSSEKPTGKIADFGGNDGTAAKAAIDAGYEAVVIDASPSRIAYAHSELSIESYLSNLHSLLFEDDAFEWGFCSHTLEHLDDPWAAAAEMIRCCKRGVWWVVPTESDEDFAADDGHLHQFTKEELLEKLKAEEIHWDGKELQCVTRK